MKTFFFILLAMMLFTSMHPPNCYIYKNDGLCYEACIETEKAVSYPQGSRKSQIYFDKAIKLCPKFSYAYYEKSVPYLKRGLFMEWKKLIDKAVELNPEQYLGYRGWCLYQFLRDYQGAIDDIEMLETLKSSDIGYSMNGSYHLKVVKGLCYKALGEKQKAIDIIKFHVLKEENEVGPLDYFHLGVLYLETKEYLRAKEALQKQLEINNYLADTYFYLAKAELKLNDINMYKEYLRTSLVYYNKGLFLKDPYIHPIDKVYFKTIEKELEKFK